MVLRCASVVASFAAAMFVGGAVVMPASAGASSTFVDVQSDGYGPALDVLAEEGVLSGCGDDRFCPDEELTRGQMATLIATALDLSDEGSGYFGDVDGTEHAQGINMLAAAGVTRGCSVVAFCPEERVTRGQLASLLVRGFEPSETDEVFFDDVDGVHAQAVNRLAAVGIAAGCSDSLVEFCPYEPVLRWQAALFIARSLDLIERVELSSLEQRREEQAAIEEEQRLEEERRLEEQQRAEREEQQRLERDRIWDSLAECESNGNWQANTGNGYYGGLQFHINSWHAVGGTGYPHHHTREEQIKRAELLLVQQGWGAWPTCSRLLGLR